MVLHIVVGIGIAFIIAFLAYEMYSWQAGGRVVSGRQKGLRVAEAVLMVTILSMILGGDAWISRQYGPLGVMIYWLSSFVLALALAVLALVDMHEARERWTKYRRENLINLIDPREEDKNDQ